MKEDKKSYESHKELTKDVDSQVSKKVQGEHASTKSRGRSLGSEYAYAVQSVLEDAKLMKGSTSSFLGVEKVSIETGELAKKAELTAPKRPKARTKKV